MKNYLSIDQGTTSSRAIIFNSELEAIVDSQIEYDLAYPKDGWVELDPGDIVKSVEKTVSNVLKTENNIKAVSYTHLTLPTILRV